MIETAKMSARGQIIIPKEIRQEIHADKDTLFAVSTLDDETIIMRRINTQEILRDFRLLRKKAPKYSDEEILNAIKSGS